MIKRTISRAVNSFAYATAINIIIFFIMYMVSDRPDYAPMFHEFADRFQSRDEAILVQIILIGFTSAIFGGGSVIMEFEKISLVSQSIIFFILTAMVWVPVSCICWQVHKYPQSMISVGLSYLVSYIISWIIQYRICKRNIDQINQKLQDMKRDL